MVLQPVANVLMTAQTLKDQLLNIDNIASDEVGMVCQQKLQKIYHDALIRDLEFSLDQKAEVDLWNHGFRNSIVTLQTQARDKKNPKRDESECRLTRFLESATAFYAGLLHDVCSAFDLELPFRRNGRNYACPKKILDPKLIAKANKNSCYYMCQYCLVHLGDLARYRHLGRQAELFYRYAVQLSPCSGHPYNQLALVEAARGDRLSTVFFYVRSMSVRHPFPAAALNLMKTLNQYVDEQIDIEGRMKLSVSECVTVFLRFHGLLSKSADLDVAEKYVKLLTNTLTALVATESFSATQLVQMLAINLYALHQKRESAYLNKTNVLSEPDMESSELQAKRLVLHLVAGSLCAFLLPVYTLKDGESLLDYFALPAIKLTLDWIHLESHVLLEAAFLSRRQIWPSLCKLLNVLQSYLLDFSAERWALVPLPEDKTLQCFIPLEGLLNNYRFIFDEQKMEVATTNKLRASRLVEFGTWLSEQEQYSLLKMRKETRENGSSVFELAYSVPSEVPNKDTSQHPAKSVSIKTYISSSSPSIVPKSLGLGNNVKVEVSSQQYPKSKTHEEVKTDGKISTNAVTSQAPAAGTGIMKKYRHNVAMQAILKKIDQDSTKAAETKQVTFRTPSPNVQDVEKKMQYKQPKNLQEKHSVLQPAKKNVALTERNKPMVTAVDSTGKSVSFSLPVAREPNHLTDKQTQSTHKIQDRIHTPSVQIEEPGKAVPFFGKSHGGQDKSYSLTTQNFQKKNVTFSDDTILSFAAQVLQGKETINKSTVPSAVLQEKTSPFFPPATKEKAVSYSSQGILNTGSMYTSANIKEQPISFSGMPAAQYSPNYKPQNLPSKSTLPKENTEFVGLHAFSDVGSFSQALFKTPLFKLPDIQELHNTPDDNAPCGQTYPANSALGTNLETAPVSQYSTETTRSHGNLYPNREIVQNAEFENVSDANNVVQPAIGSEHSPFQSSGLNSTLSYPCTPSVGGCSTNAMPPPGYSTVQVPEQSQTWWKREETPSAPMATWWKPDTGLEDGHQYTPVGYVRNASATKTDTGYVSHLWNFNAAVDVNLHHKLVGAYSTAEAPPGVFTRDIYRTEVSSCNVDSYIESGSVYSRQSQPPPDSTYSLFSSTTLTSPVSSQQEANCASLPCVDKVAGFGTQSLWSGPGPSPLERLLEQQKRLREGPTLKKGT